MAEVVEQVGDLDRRAELAKQSTMEMECLIDDFKPFLLARVARYAPHSVDQREELFGTAMMAFYEAIRSFDVGKGHFFPFANRVVSSRIIDSIRSIYRQESKNIPLEETGGELPADHSGSLKVVSIRSFEEARQKEQLADEIEQFKAELSTWGVSMEALVKNSPKHAKLRETYKTAVAAMIKAPEVIQTIQIKRYFPVKEITKITGLPPKKFERGRTFIIALLIIKMGDYDYLSDYISDGR